MATVGGRVEAEAAEEPLAGVSSSSTWLRQDGQDELCASQRPMLCVHVP